MLTPSKRPPGDEELIQFVRAWLNALADGKLEEGCAQLDEPNTYGIRWTPEALRGILTETFGPNSHFRSEHPEGPVFSSVDDASGDGHPSVVPFEDGSGYSVEHDVP